jgi:hypothetical protein
MARALLLTFSIKEKIAMDIDIKYRIIFGYRYRTGKIISILSTENINNSARQQSHTASAYPGFFNDGHGSPVPAKSIRRNYLFFLINRLNKLNFNTP